MPSGADPFSCLLAEYQHHTTNPAISHGFLQATRGSSVPVVLKTRNRQRSSKSPLMARASFLVQAGDKVTLAPHLKPGTFLAIRIVFILISLAGSSPALQHGFYQAGGKGYSTARLLALGRTPYDSLLKALPAARFLSHPE